MLEKLQTIINKYESLREESLKPEIFEDMEKAKKINKELSSMEKTYELAVNYKKALETERDALDLINNESDADLVEMAQEELNEVRPKIEEYDRQLTIALLPKDPNDDKNIFLEIRPAA
jgi:peptide chain release factor 1